MRVLGISPLHDSTVAVVNNGEVEFFFKEERFTRIKRDGYPVKSILKVLENLKDPIDHFCISSPNNPDGEHRMLVTMLAKMFNCPGTDYNSHHHLSHASLAFYNSGFQDALVFVIDRDGSVIENCAREAETVFRANYPCNFKVLQKNLWVFDNFQGLTASNLPFECNTDSTMSITKVYESATTLIGQKPLENGKTMGLSSYGNTNTFDPLFINNRPNDRLFSQGKYIFDHFDTTIYKNYIPYITKDVTRNNYQFYADYAYQVQTQTQEQVLNLVRKWVEKTGIKKVCMTGGYALNVVCNGYLIKNLPEVKFYFEPLADDSGNSIGAAMHLYRTLTQDTTVKKINHTFVHGTTSEKINVNGSLCDYKNIAESLSEQKSVAVFNGLAESGPRALGNRSILFDPRNLNAKDIVNKIKNREWYRPFAAMVLEEDFQDYFETHGLSSAEFMTVSFQCKKLESIPGVVHVDGSCRVQTVNKSIPHIYNLLIEFKKLTGCSVLLNTSFNLAGEPLVETVDDAIATYNNSPIDILWFPELQQKIG